MKFSASIIIAAIAAAAPALAITSPTTPNTAIEVRHAKADGSAFCTHWKSACINYMPYQQNFKFYAATCIPGDLNRNNRMRVAIVNCQFTNGTNYITVNQHVSKLVGARIG